MKLLHVLFAVCLLCCAIAAPAQETLNNEAIVKLVKEGVTEDAIVRMVKSQPGNYHLGTTDVMILKSANVPDKVIAAMAAKGARGSGSAESGEVSRPARSAQTFEIGVYYRKGGSWTDLPPEIVNFKSGSMFKSIGTAGVVKRDVNGRVHGAHSRTTVKPPVRILVHTPEGVAITEYMLFRLRENKDSREFRTMADGSVRDLVPFESKKVSSRTYELILPSVGNGEFGLLPPGSGDTKKPGGKMGKVYSFRISE